MRVFLVDFENVKSDGLRCVDCLSEGDQVITFFSKNAESLSMDTYFNLVSSKASFHAVRLDRTGSNALDFQLVAYLGYLMGTPEHQDVYVISKDHGFYSAATFCRNFLIPQSKYKKTVTQYPSIASLFPNHVETRPAAINSIPLFMNGTNETQTVQIVNEPVMEPTVAEQPKEVMPVEQPIEQEAVKQPIEQVVKTEEVHSAPVSPKRREVKVGKSSEKEHRPSEQKQTAPKQPEKKPQENKPHSDWDEITAAAEVGLQIIDMFGSSEPPKKEQKRETKAVKAVKEEVKLPQPEKEIEIIDLFASIEAPAKQEVAEPVIPMPQQEENPIVKQEPKSEVKADEQMLSGAEIDKMLEEFLEEAAAVIEQELKAMPTQEQLPEFIEVDAKPKEEDAPVENAPANEPQRSKRTERKRNAPKKAAEKEEKSVEQEIDQPTAPVAEKQTEQKPSRRKSAEKRSAKQADAPKEKEEKSAPKEEAAPKAEDSAALARQHVKKVLSTTLEIEEEAKDDLEKLIDCIIDASGKQDLYRMIIKLFGQKTGLEYYKVVKREYTNICNQIGKK